MTSTSDTDAILDQAPDAILLCDREGHITFANSRSEELFGYTFGELQGEEVELLLPGGLRSGHRQLRQSYAAHPVRRPMGLGLNLLARRKDGSEFPVEISLSPIRINGHVLFVAFIRDVKDRRELEEERERLREEFSVMDERQRIGMDLHDGIMQSVFAIGLRLELISADLDPASPLSHELEAAMDAAHDVVRDIRSYIFDLRPRDFSGQLDLALEHLVAEFRENSRIPTELTIDAPGVQDLEDAVAVALYQVAHEALSNARKYAEATSISVRLVSPRAGQLLLEIEDDGRGFDLTANRDEVHRGLRNMAVRAQQHDGRLEIQSQPGAGTTVRMIVAATRTSC